MKIVRCNEGDYATLAGIWERSVRATHGFLREEHFQGIKAALIPLYHSSSVIIRHISGMIHNSSWKVTIRPVTYRFLWLMAYSYPPIQRFP